MHSALVVQLHRLDALHTVPAADASQLVDDAQPHALPTQSGLSVLHGPELSTTRQPSDPVVQLVNTLLVHEWQLADPATHVVAVAVHLGSWVQHAALPSVPWQMPAVHGTVSR
jgi:hypothetical protein